MTHRQYLALDRFPAIDGLRAVSILLVLTWHTNSTAYHRLQGWVGVTIFFVISGYLITTLLLREEQTAGRVSLRAFMRRRAYRILPVYAVVLGFYVVLVIVLNWHGNRRLLVDQLPYYLSFTNDFGPFVTDTPFQHSWSLGVEEKFYLLWPLLAFVLLRRRMRIPAAAALAVAPLLLLPFGVAARFHDYAAIMVGCLLALAMHHPVGYRRLAFLGRPWAACAALVALVAAHGQLTDGGSNVVTDAYPFAVALVVVALVTTTNPLARILSTAPARLLGRLSYGVYLVHLAVASFVSTTLRHVGMHNAPNGLPLGFASNATTLVVVPTVSFLVAAVLYRYVEKPCIIRGHRPPARRETEAPAAATVRA